MDHNNKHLLPGFQFPSAFAGGSDSLIFPCSLPINFKSMIKTGAGGCSQGEGLLWEYSWLLKQTRQWSFSHFMLLFPRLPFSCTHGNEVSFELRNWYPRWLMFLQRHPSFWAIAIVKFKTQNSVTHSFSKSCRGHLLFLLNVLFSPALFWDKSLLNVCAAGLPVVFSDLPANKLFFCRWNRSRNVWESLTYDLYNLLSPNVVSCFH